MIYAPAKNRMFYSYKENFAFELINGKNIKLDSSKNFKKDEIKFVSYSNKLKPQIEEIHKKLNVKKYIRMKSSLKFCVIAAGEYDGYVAEPRACEWDIAAGHAILKHAGGNIADFNGNEIKPDIVEIHKKLNVKNYTKMKSSLKFCVVATGEYDGYVAEPRAYEWDIAAGHAILKHSIFCWSINQSCCWFFINY